MEGIDDVRVRAVDALVKPVETVESDMTVGPFIEPLSRRVRPLSPALTHSSKRVERSGRPRAIRLTPFQRPGRPATSGRARRRAGRQRPRTSRRPRRHPSGATGRALSAGPGARGPANPPSTTLMPSPRLKSPTASDPSSIGAAPDLEVCRSWPPAGPGLPERVLVDVDDLVVGQQAEREVVQAGDVAAEDERRREQGTRARRARTARSGVSGVGTVCPFQLLR